MEMIRGTEEGSKDKEYLGSVREEYRRLDIIRLCRTVNCTEWLSQTFLIAISHRINRTNKIGRQKHKLRKDSIFTQCMTNL